ncbi:hypothetical protein HOA91_04735 [Candidatus Woesearchaeota archaeon]|jgi:hypothetical protein|nr:hypothetical protein [Candidatus Woesearchaeota archaeon]
MKLNKLLTLTLLFLVALAFLALAAEDEPPALEDDPPVLDNHQFYGKVQWDKDDIAPVLVIAKIGETSYQSTIEDGATCDDVVCLSKYGYIEIIRVLGFTEDQVDIYLDDTLIESFTYENKAQQFDINIASVPFSCDPDWDCGAWTNCTNKTKTRFCVDDNKCNPKELNKTITNKCSLGVTEIVTASPTACYYLWDCTTWGSCINNQKSRVCTRTDTCDADFAAGTVDSVVTTPKLSEKDVCLSSTTTTPEAPLPPSAPKLPSFQPVEEKSNLIFYIIGIVVFLLIVGGILVYFFVIKKKGGPGLDANVKSQLSSIFQRGKQGGLSEGQVKEKLVSKGWQEGMVNKFLGKK